MTEKFQLFGPLDQAAYDALREDIQANGVLIPIERDADTGEILDGHNRHAIATELGIECPEVLRKFASDQARQEHVLKVNLCRRQLTPREWAKAFRRLCELRGVEVRPKGGRPKNRTGATENGEKKTVSNETVSGVARSVGVSAETARTRLARATKAAAPPPPPPPRQKVMEPGKDLLPHVEAAFADKRIADWRKALSAVSREMEKAKDDPFIGPWLSKYWQTIVAAGRNLSEALKFCQPYADCVLCAQRGCKECLNTGWLPRDIFNAVPEANRRRSVKVKS